MLLSCDSIGVDYKVMDLSYHTVGYCSAESVGDFIVVELTFGDFVAEVGLTD